MEYANFHRRFRYQTRVVCRGVMICIKTQHFKYQRILFLLLGLWPYQQTKFTQLQIILISGMLMSCILYQLTALAFAEYTPNVLIGVLSFSLFFIICVIVFLSFRLNVDRVKWLLDELQHICDELTDENEIAIITKHGSVASRYTVIIMLIFVVNVTFILLSMMLLHLLDTALLVDETPFRRALQNILPESFVAKDIYLFLMAMHFIGTTILGGILLIGTGMLLVAYLKHACGMFRIASYRIEKAMTVNMLKSISLKNKILICKKIIHAVDIHRKAIKFCIILCSDFQGTLFVVTGICVICLSINLYKITETMLSRDDFNQLYVHVGITFAMFLYLFSANYIGQEVIDYNYHVIFTAYNVRWYIAPLHIQRLILILLQRSSKEFCLNIGGAFTFSMEFFATLTKASLSYFTVIYSTQK